MATLKKIRDGGYQPSGTSAQKTRDGSGTTAVSGPRLVYTPGTEKVKVTYTPKTAAQVSGNQSRGGGFGSGSSASTSLQQVRQRRGEQPSGLERVGLTVLSGLKGMGTDLASAAPSLYESGQKNRDAQNQELLK